MMDSGSSAGRTAGTVAYIGIGSNLGDRKAYLFGAVERLHQHHAVDVIRCSSIYETAPIGLKEQPDYLNMAIAVHSSLQPHELLNFMLAIEQSMGRVRDVRFGPRTIDLDLLMFGQEKLQTELLELPHPRIKERAFVLIPFLEIAGQSVNVETALLETALCEAEGKDDVHLWQRTNWHSALGRFEN
jgi:2-amino-4-hydroxy-6-hydroxymethyldihydropteridine diphosphokinase